MLSLRQPPNTATSNWESRNSGKLLEHFHYQKVISGSEPVDLLKPNGEPLLLFRPNTIPRHTCDQAHKEFRRLGSVYNNRRGYHSSIAGSYWDKGQCRKTAFVANDVRRFLECVPFIRACDQAFRKEMPERYANQRRVADLTKPEFTISDTAFTTLTVNTWDATHDARTPVHRDKGDYSAGFGVISVLSGGDYAGGFLVFPEHRVAVDMRTSDVLLADVHELHGNAPIVGQPGWARIAVILYYRTEMQQCPRV